VIAAAVVVLVIALRPAPTNQVDTAPEPTPTPSTTVVTDQEPTGCLGGPERDAAMLLAAQAAAPHTTSGAVEVATAFTRWIQRYPLPTGDEAASVQQSVLTANSFTDDLPGYLDSSKNLSGGILPDGQTYYMSSVPGVWHTESAEPDSAVVTIGTAFVVDGELSPQLRSSITVNMTWADGVWKVADANGTRATQDLYAIGTTFTGGC
jgi:hypothetical protein